MSARLTKAMREGIRLTELRGIRYNGDPNVYTPLTSEATFADAWTCWLNFRTARALERRGLGRCQGWGDEAEFVLFPITTSAASPGRAYQDSDRVDEGTHE